MQLSRFFSEKRNIKTAVHGVYSINTATFIKSLKGQDWQTGFKNASALIMKDPDLTPRERCLQENID